MDFRRDPDQLKPLMSWSDYMRGCFEQNE